MGSEMTPRNATAFEVPGNSPARQPGAYRFILNAIGQQLGIVHACPCGCGNQSTIFFKGKSVYAGGAEWEVTGEWPKVTLAPSIGIKPKDPATGLYHWHGFLENGEFVER
jgi:uncharacterized protein DUF6527